MVNVTPKSSGSDGRSHVFLDIYDIIIGRGNRMPPKGCRVVLSLYTGLVAFE